MGRKPYKLSDDDVRWIRNVGRYHSTTVKMAIQFKVSQGHIWDILHGKRRREVPDRV